MNGRLGDRHRRFAPYAGFGLLLLMLVFSFVLPAFAGGAWVSAVQFVLWFLLLIGAAVYKAQADAKAVRHMPAVPRAEAKAGGPFGQWHRGLRRSGRIGLWMLLSAGFGVGGWFSGYRFWHDPATGVLAGLFALLVVYGVTDAGIRSVIVDPIVAFFLGVPLIYALVLFAQLPLLALGLVPFSAHAYFVKPVPGALMGTGLSVLWNLKGTFSTASEPGFEGSRAALHRLFLAGVEVRTPVAFLIAVVFVAPGHNSFSLIVIGALWGMVAAAIPVVFTVLADHKTVRAGWPVIVIIEAVLVLSGLAGGLSGHSRMEQTLDLVLPAAITCAVTYGLADLITTATTLLRSAPTAPAAQPALTVPAAGPDHPALPRRSAISVRRPGRDRNRDRSPGQGRRARRSKRRPRRRR